MWSLKFLKLTNVQKNSDEPQQVWHRGLQCFHLKWWVWAGRRSLYGQRAEMLESGRTADAASAVIRFKPWGNMTLHWFFRILNENSCLIFFFNPQSTSDMWELQQRVVIPSQCLFPWNASWPEQLSTQPVGEQPVKAVNHAAGLFVSLHDIL